MIIQNSSPAAVVQESSPLPKLADHYFRPWKIYADVTKDIKARIQTSDQWIAKADEYKDFLLRIYSLVEVKPKLLSNMVTLLWSTTYLVAIRDCERFASCQSSESDSTGNVKDKLYLANIIAEEDWLILTELACWVWEERFLRSGYELKLGNNFCGEVIEVCIVSFL